MDLNRAFSISVPLIGVFLTSCHLSCTLIGCDSELFVKFPASTSSPVTVIATSPDAGNRTQDCTFAGCTSVSLRDYLPKAVHIKVVAGNVVVAEKDFVPVYTKSEPNGPKCDPTCIQGTVQL